ncbi:MAG: GMC oxidoreductase [Burkholderiales bacterium]
MSIVDARRLEPNALVRADICVVGAGAAGITIASAFESSAHSVCLLESGHYQPDETVQSLYDIEVAGYPVSGNFMSRARYFGGTCNLWAGRSVKLTKLDLEARDWVPYSGWPLSYAELDRYYGRSAGILKLPSDERVREVVDRRMSPFERALVANEDLQPNLSVWARAPLRFGRAYKGLMRRSRNIDVYLGASATEIVLNPGGDAVDELKAATLNGRKISVRAKRYVLACGGLENPRLLLLSRSVQKNGIGNDFDAVGRFYMDHPQCVLGTVRLSGAQTLPLLLAWPLPEGTVQLGIRLSDAAQRRERLLNHYVSLERQWSPGTASAYGSLVRSMKITFRRGYAGRRFAFADAKLDTVPETIYLLSPRQLMPHSVYRILKTFRHAFGRHLAEVSVTNYCEQAPQRNSRVYLSEQRDALNLNRLVLDWKMGPEVTRTLVRTQQLLDLNLRKNGLGHLSVDWTREEPAIAYRDAAHHMGTTRMSEQPATGVVDANCKVHGVDNLYIAGSSVFPTGGHANPTWTIVALALRLADRLKATAR